MTLQKDIDSFIMALVKFVGRQGSPREVCRDNRSDVVRFVSELKESEILPNVKNGYCLLAKEIQLHLNHLRLAAESVIGALDGISSEAAVGIDEKSTEHQ